MNNGRKIPFKVIDDGMACVLIPIEMDEDTTLDGFFETLKSQGIIFGIDKATLDSIFASSERSRDPVIIARGVPAAPGMDARIIQCYRNPDPDLQSLDDFRSMVKLAKKDEVLAVKLKATQGVPGRTVYGDTILSSAGQDLEFSAGKNILQRYYEDKIEFSAFKEGIVRMGPGSIQIESLHLIDHDINLSSGNLNLDSSVFINGDITPSYKVSAAGSVSIAGSLVKAEVTARNDVNIFKRVSGGSRVISGGRIFVSAAVHSLLHASGDVVIENDVVHTEIVSGGRVIIGDGHGSISAGEIRAVESIIVGDVGTPLGSQPRLILGMVSSLTELESSLNDKDSRINHIKNMMIQYRRGESVEDWTFRHLQTRLETLENERDDLVECIRKLNATAQIPSALRKVVINGKVSRGSKILIGNSEYIVPRDTQGVAYFLNESTGDIQCDRTDKECEGGE